MGFFDITATYSGGQSAPYIPRFEPLSPLNDGTTGQGAGQGMPPRIINWYDIIPKDQENVFYALGNRLKDLAGSLDAYKGALEKSNRMASRYSSSLHDYNANINSLERIKKERHDSFTTAKRLKELIRQEEEKKRRFSKELRLFFDFQEKEYDKQENIQQGLFKRKEFKALDMFLTNPYAILPKGFIFEYYNPGSNNYETYGLSINALSKKYGVSVSLIRKFKIRDKWEKKKITNEVSTVLKDKLTTDKMGLFLDTKKEEVKEALKQSLENLDLDPVVVEAIAETSSDELILKAMNTAYIKKQILFCAIVARGELIKMIKRAGDKVKDNINIIVAAEKVSKLFIDAGVSLFGKEQIQAIECKENSDCRKMNISELIALANADDNLD
ncbi:hypothetical protein C2R49_06080 [Helicobacter pylori]|nr:hypothetical protein [Helicobacter pylori]PUD65751.1 hypothetical protein C2R49_06080 [Helicobacter pylori]